MVRFPSSVGPCSTQGSEICKRFALSRGAAGNAGLDSTGLLQPQSKIWPHALPTRDEHLSSESIRFVGITIRPEIYEVMREQEDLSLS